MKLLRALVSLGLFLGTFLVIHVVHCWFLPVDVIFYSALLDGLLATVVGGICLFFLPLLRTILSNFEKGLLVVIMAFSAYSFAITVPTVIDRSLSFYILEKLEQRGGAIPYSDFETVFTKEYVKEFHLVDVRITEQLSSRTIVLEDGVVRLTPWGRFLSSASHWYRTNLLAKHRLLMGNYTDVLTDPFKQAPKP